MERVDADWLDSVNRKVDELTERMLSNEVEMGEKELRSRAKYSTPLNYVRSFKDVEAQAQGCSWALRGSARNWQALQPL